MRHLVTLSILQLISFELDATAACLSLVKGPIVLDVESCRKAIPAKDFSTDNPHLEFINALDPKRKADFYATYSGLISKGIVYQSQAIQTDFASKKGALVGEAIEVFIPSGSQLCSELIQKRLSGALQQSCCEDATSPCLYGLSYVFRPKKVRVFSQMCG